MKRKQVGIGNWRLHPQSQWAFQHVRELMPTAAIERTTSTTKPLSTKLADLVNINVESPAGDRSLKKLLTESHTDSLIVLHHGTVVTEWHAPNSNPNNPHILFSISKSITAILAGILEEKGYIDSDNLVADYLPLVKGSVYGNCTVRHLLDMSVALDFEENYTDENSEYVQYRIATGWNPIDQAAPGPGLEAFLYGLKQTDEVHGHRFLYRSPNTDLLGLVLERAAVSPLPELLSRHLWKPMGAETEAYITLDHFGTSRAAGGICVTLHDLARTGQLFLENGQVDGHQVIPSTWIEDTCNNGDQAAWDRGNYKHKLPNGKYRNQWYQTGDCDKSISARGIHGQLLYINPSRSVVIAKLACQPEPLNDAMTASFMSAFEQIAKQLD